MQQEMSKPRTILETAATCMIPRDLSLFVCDLLAVRPW